MSFSFGKNKREKERDTLFEAVKISASSGDTGFLSTTFLAIRDRGLTKDPEFPFLLESAITAVTENSLDKGLAFGIWAYGMTQDDAELRKALSVRILTLIGKADRNDLDLMATVATAADSVASHTEPGSDEHQQAKREWGAAIDTLGAKKEGLGYAFGAASSAAIGLENDRPLRKDAIEKWDNLVVELAKTDRREAITEALRVKDGYEDFGAGAAEIRNRAASVLTRVMKMGH